jgi:predicted PhzF superfamily epimerase YddE/YHI9
MRIPLYQVDAFTGRAFAGNPAAVCLLPRWPDDRVLGDVAAENCLPETAFLVPGGRDYDIRWFTPEVEIDLCGHATLAAGWVVLSRLEPGRPEVAFRSRQAGLLRVDRDGDRLALDFPSRPAEPADPPPALRAALGGAPRECFRARDYLAVMGSEAEVRALRPDLASVRELDAQGLIVTAPGEACDFVSRYFAPRAGIDEDPVTGSAHCTLTPFWAARLGRTELTARQVSRRGGELWCALRGDRVRIAGQVAPYLEGFAEIPIGPP